jgi:transcriptional regulator with XRE-family HTH domain|tara:strand:+ start:798 stop:1139 length:342 start_codon:yes stop_codon:yes gene_type:complete
MNWDELRHRLIEARAVAQFSRAELAEALGVVRMTIYNWENGERMPHIEHLRLWAEAVGLVLSFELSGPDDQAYEADHELLVAFMDVAAPEAVDAVRRLLVSYVALPSEDVSGA